VTCTDFSHDAYPHFPLPRLHLHSTHCTGFIVTTKVTPSYWRATFHSPPLNIEGTDFFPDFYTLIDQIANDTLVNIVVFDSDIEGFWIAHWDIINNPPSNLTSDNSVYWSNVTKLANLPVLTVTKIRGIARGGGAEIAAALDVRFASERALFRTT
jgi:enoyl-CoA hydratase/carnithine racemase